MRNIRRYLVSSAAVALLLGAPSRLCLRLRSCLMVVIAFARLCTRHLVVDYRRSVMKKILAVMACWRSRRQEWPMRPRSAFGTITIRTGPSPALVACGGTGASLSPSAGDWYRHPRLPVLARSEQLGRPDANAAVTFDGTPITGTALGLSSDKLLDLREPARPTGPT